MPIYEYACEQCGHRFEKLVAMNADAPDCPECAAADVRKLVSASAFILKGSGWYKDHYGLKKSGGSSDAGTSTSSGGGTTSNGSGSSGTPSTPSGGSGSTSTSTPAASPTPPSK